jgi:hypothetical protein
MAIAWVGRQYARWEARRAAQRVRRSIHAELVDLITRAAEADHGDLAVALSWVLLRWQSRLPMDRAGRLAELVRELVDETERAGERELSNQLVLALCRWQESREERTRCQG